MLAAILIPFFLFGDAIEAWAATLFASAGDTVITFAAIALLAGDIVLPVPSSLVSLATGAALGLWPAAIVIWTGMTLGCLIGWAAGRGLLAPVQRSISVQSKHNAPWTVWGLVLCRAIPVLAEGSVLVAAARGMKLSVLMTVCSLANLPIAVLYAWFGSALLGDVPFAVLIGTAAAICILLVGGRRLILK